LLTHLNQHLNTTPDIATAAQAASASHCASAPDIDPISPDTVSTDTNDAERSLRSSTSPSTPSAATNTIPAASVSARHSVTSDLDSSSADTAASAASTDIARSSLLGWSALLPVDHPLWHTAPALSLSLLRLSLQQLDASLRNETATVSRPVHSTLPLASARTSIIDSASSTLTFSSESPAALNIAASRKRSVSAAAVFSSADREASAKRNAFRPQSSGMFKQFTPFFLVTPASTAIRQYFFVMALR
jgi:hypothetical protein